MTEQEPTQQPEEIVAHEYDREEQASRLLDFLDRVHANEVFDTKEHKMAYIKSLTFEQFTHLLMHINGILRDIPMKERAIFEDVEMVPDEGTGLAAEMAQLKPSEMPLPQDKPELLKYAFERVCELDDPRDIGLCLATALNAIHVFGDGNGRTSRLVYDLMNYSYTGSERDNNFLRTTIGAEGRFVTPDANPTRLLDAVSYNILGTECAIGQGRRLSLPGRGLERDINGRDDLTAESKKKLLFLKKRNNNNEDFAVRVAKLRWLKDTGQVDRYSSLPEVRDNDEVWGFDDEKIFKNITPREINFIYDEFWKVKKETVKGVVDILVENNNLPDIKPFKPIPARDFARQEIGDHIYRYRHEEDLMGKWPEYPEATT